MNKERIIAVEGRILRIPVSNSMLDSLERRGDRESSEMPPRKEIINYYNQQLNKVDPNGEKALKCAREMYEDKLLWQNLNFRYWQQYSW